MARARGLRCWLTNSDQNAKWCPSRNSSLCFLRKFRKRRCKARRFTNHKTTIRSTTMYDVQSFDAVLLTAPNGRGCRFHRPENTLFWQVCHQQSQGSTESSNLLTSKISEPKKRQPFRARACAQMRMCRRHHFRFRSFFEVC